MAYVLYSPTQAQPQQQQQQANIFTKYNLLDYDKIQRYIVTDIVPTMKLMQIFALYQKIIGENRNLQLNIVNVFRPEIVTRQLVLKQYMKKHYTGKELILIHIDENSLINDIYYILAIRKIYNLEQINMLPDEDHPTQVPPTQAPPTQVPPTQVPPTQLTVQDYFKYVIYTDYKGTAEENTIVSKQFIHKISTILPFINNNILNGNELFGDLITYNKKNKEVTKTLLYNMSNYTIVSTNNDLLYCFSTMLNNFCTYVYPSRIIDPTINNIIKQKNGLKNNINTKGDLNAAINKRFVSI